MATYLLSTGKFFRVAFPSAAAATLLFASCAVDSQEEGGRVTGAVDSSSEERPICVDGELTGVSLDVPGPGAETPASAVETYRRSSGTELQTLRTDETATIFERLPTGVVTRQFEVRELADGWWIQSYADCN